MRLAVAVVAVALVVACAYAGRRDLTRPWVVFAISWFGFVALAQLQLSRADAGWTNGFAALVVGGGLAFIGASIAAGGTRSARPTVSVTRDLYSPSRLVAAALVLMCAAAGGWVYKAHVLGGIPLFSGSADVVRARASTLDTGHATLPTWSTMLTAGFYLGFWCLVLALWVDWRTSSRGRRAAIAALALVALIGVGFDASRSLMLSTLSVPVVAVYMIFRPAQRRARLVRIGVVAAVLAAVVGGLFVARLGQTQGSAPGTAFVNRELDRHPVALRPLLPFYLSGVLPFDGYASVYAAIPARAPYGYGAYSLLSLPDKAFSHGKPDYADLVSVHLSRRGVGRFWTVATYQGRAFADAGAGGVVLTSILLGLMFGGVYRAVRRRSGLFPLVVIAYLVYYSAVMSYDDPLSFTLIGVYDLAAVYLLERFARRRVTVGRFADG